MEPLTYLRPQGRQPRFSRVELARMFWRAAYYVRRQRPLDEHTNELLAYLEREFRTTWLRANGPCQD
jgi:hypothetical protein